MSGINADALVALRDALGGLKGRFSLSDGTGTSLAEMRPRSTVRKKYYKSAVNALIYVGSARSGVDAN